MTGARCNFCGRTFRNQQAVRAHLKSCPAYRQLPKATVPRVGNTPGTSRSRTSAPGTPPVPEPKPEDSRPRRQAPLPASDSGHGSLNPARRRLVIQSVKNEVIGSWWSLGHTIPSETKAQALAAIEQELSRLPTDQLPRSEVVTIAEGIRDRIYRPVIAAQQRAREDAERQRTQARQRTALIAAGVAQATRVLRQHQDIDGWSRLDLEQKIKRALEQEVDGSESEPELQARVGEIIDGALKPMQQAGREKARQELVAHGLDYATQELAQEENLTLWERSSIARDVKLALKDEIAGEESEREVEALVDDVLDEVLGETEDDEEEDDETEDDE